LKGRRQVKANYPAAAATAAADGWSDPCAASTARVKSGGRNGFCRQTTSESSGISGKKSSAVIPEIAMTGRPGTRARGRAGAQRRNQIGAVGALQKNIDDRKIEAFGGSAGIVEPVGKELVTRRSSSRHGFVR
jgi:hypothetical protein